MSIIYFFHLNSIHEHAFRFNNLSFGEPLLSRKYCLLRLLLLLGDKIINVKTDNECTCTCKVTMFQNTGNRCLINISD